MAAHGAVVSEPPCKYCNTPNPARQCRYTWWLPYAADFKKSGADRPCDMYAWSEKEMRNDRKIERVFRWLVVGAVTLLALAWGVH
jgi:hypothetical protein